MTSEDSLSLVSYDATPDMKSHFYFVPRFCGAFVRAVHDVTGKLYGPDTYRMLLQAYAPDRRPSTPTLVGERDAYERTLRDAARAGDAAVNSGAARHDLPPAAAPAPAGPNGLEPAPSTPSAPSAQTLASRTSAPPTVAPGVALAELSRLINQGWQSEVDYLRTCIADRERRLADAMAVVTHESAERRAAVALAEAAANELTELRAVLAREQEQVARLTDEVAGQRLFALQSIELSRAETRLMRERMTTAELALARQEMVNDQLRIALSKAPGTPR